MSKLARARRPLIVLAALFALLVLIVPPAAGETTAAQRGGVAKAGVDRVLVLSLPAISWADLRSARVPTLDKLFAESALADLTTRSVRTRTSAGDGYLTLGSGARVVSDSSVAGQNLDPGERYGDDPATDVFARRLGYPMRGQVGALGMPSFVDANDKLLYDAEPGALGTALRDAHVRRAVIGNADRGELVLPADRLHREAALALVDDTGRTPGTVDTSLVEPNEAAPFGLEMDVDAMVRAFRRAWPASGRAVVLVEASDLARADAYRPFASADQRRAMRVAALHRTDQLVSELLRSVGPRDAVLTVGPYHTGRQRELTIGALRAPGVEPGWLNSSTTRRPGYVGVTDVAPTILDRLGIDVPDSMEGRPFTVDATSKDYDARLDFLIDGNRAAVFRDATIGTATALLVVLALLLGAGMLALARWPSRRGSTVLELVALALIGFLAATFLAGLLPFFRWGGGAYWLFVLAVAVAVALVATVAGRRDRLLPVVLALGLLTAIHLVDALTGAHLELDTVFGYTPTVGIRVAGLGNPGSAQLSAAALLFVALLVARYPGRRVRLAGVILLAVTAAVIAAPFFGQDFGGAISVTPAYVLLAVMLYDRRVSLRGVLTLAGVLVLSGLAAGFADLMRPADQRTHVGRFFEKVGNDGFGGFTTVVERKASLMLGTFHNTGWVLLVVLLVAGLVYLGRRTEALARVAAKVSTLRAALWGFAVMAVLGMVLNDSGIQVPGMMLAVLVPTVAWLSGRDEDGSLSSAPGA
jgi:hypothetical protein